jgi:sulfite reductase alpha subunit-like flavoprotein
MATLYILYGSATGNAEGIAKDLAENKPPAGFSSIICEPLEKFKKYSDKWLQEPAAGNKHGVILISSTTGNADPPENASRFIRYIKRKPNIEIQPFQNVAFCTLALGDTNYDQFCAIGRLIDKKMGELGGTRAKKLACADEATGLEDVVEPWIDTVFVDIQKACFGEAATNAATNAATATSSNTTATTTAAITTSVTATPQEKQSEAASAAATADTSESKPSPAETASAQSTTVTTPPPEKSESPLFILYTSATGNAEQISKDLASTYEVILGNPDAQTFFPSVVCCQLDEYKKKCMPIWEQAPVPGTKHGVLVVASTTGNGETPENGDRFMRFLKRKQTVESQPLQHVSFAVLGLGDTNYDQFCNTGKMLDKRLAEAGGTHAKKLACADEATGLEDVVDPWINTILMEITTACRGGVGVTTTAAADTTTAATMHPKKNKQAEEEKKSEMSEPEPPVSMQPSSSSSVGVQIVRSLLNLDDKACSIPQVKHSDLPGLGSSRSSCELFSGDDLADADAERMRQRGSSFDDRATVSSGSAGSLYYTLDKPFETSILNARYLTKTSTDAAAKVCEQWGPSGMQSRADVMATRELIDQQFPLDGPDAARNGKRVIELTMALPDDYTLEYQPGDSLGLIVSNSPEAISFVLNMLRERHGIESTQKVSIDSNKPITVEEAVCNRIDLCSPLKNTRIIHSLSQFATDQEEANVLGLLSSKTSEGERLFQELIVEQRRSVFCILQDFPSCQNIPLEGLLSILPGIPSRYYSVSSSPLDKSCDALSLTVAFSIVDYLTPSLVVNGEERGRRRIYGIATRYIEAICSSFLSGGKATNLPPLKIFPKPAADFRLPPAIATPIVLIGPGTGIAPFMGFLSHRRALVSSKASTEAASTIVEGTWRGDYEMEAEDLPVGKNDTSGLALGADYRSHQNVGSVDVFFGCRHADHDQLYQDEMAEFQKEGIITQQYNAFSRDGERQYVQDIMRTNAECGSRLVDIIVNKRGIVYICGDGNKMAKGVQGAIAELLGNKLGGGVDDGKAYIEELKSKGRFLLDIWS